MSDEMPAAPITAPVAIPTPAQPWMFQPSNEQIVRSMNDAKNARMLADHDAARAAAGKVTLVATVGFMVVDEENPNGRIINPGDEFEISEFDLPRYVGRGLPRHPDARRDTTGI